MTTDQRNPLDPDIADEVATEWERYRRSGAADLMAIQERLDRGYDRWKAEYEEQLGMIEQVRAQGRSDLEEQIVDALQRIEKLMGGSPRLNRIRWMVIDALLEERIQNPSGDIAEALDGASAAGVMARIYDVFPGLTKDTVEKSLGKPARKLDRDQWIKNRSVELRAEGLTRSECIDAIVKELCAIAHKRGWGTVDKYSVDKIIPPVD